MKSFAKFAMLLAAVALGASAKADTIVYYSFNNSAGSTTLSGLAQIVADTGATISSFTNFSGNGTSRGSISGINANNQVGFAAGNAVSMSGWNANNSYWQFTLDSTGYENFTLSWAWNRSSTGPADFNLQYSSTGTGGVFTTFANILVPTTAGPSFTQDLSAVSAIENNPNVVFRLVGQNSPSSGGTSKIDNLTIDGFAIVPEPSTVFLTGLGLLGLIALRRRR